MNKPARGVHTFRLNLRGLEFKGRSGTLLDAEEVCDRTRTMLNRIELVCV